MATLKSFRELIVWQKSMDLAQKVYGQTQGFPREEIYGLTSQMRRAAVSIPSNIAEGQSRTSTAEFRHHLSIARGSLAELETQVELACLLRFLPATEAQTLTALCQEVGRLLNGLLRSLPSDR